MLPTPTTMDHLPPRSVDSMIKQTTIHRKGRTKLANLREALNPQTVELFNHLQSLPTPTARDYKGRTSAKWNEKYGPKGTTRRLNPDWRSYVSKPILRRGDDGLSYRVDRTKALGNSVVPQVAAIPLKRVHDLYYNE